MVLVSCFSNLLSVISMLFVLINLIRWLLLFISGSWCMLLLCRMFIILVSVVFV